MGFKKRARKGPKKGRGSLEPSGVDVEEIVEDYVSGSEPKRLIHEHNRIMRMAAFPNNGLIFECRKFTEMALIAYIHHHDIEIDPADNKTLDGLIHEIKGRPELTVSKLTLKHIDSLRAYGNIASHAQIEIQSPQEIWDAIKNPFQNVAKWILFEVLSVDDAVLLEPQSPRQLIESEVWAGIQNLGASEVDGEMLVDFDDIWNDKIIQKSFFSSMEQMHKFSTEYMPEAAKFFDKAMTMVIKYEDWDLEKKIILLSYCWRLAWWSSMANLQGILTDYDTLYSEIGDTDLESRAEIIEMLQKWEDDRSRARKV